MNQSTKTYSLSYTFLFLLIVWMMRKNTIIYHSTSSLQALYIWHLLVAVLITFHSCVDILFFYLCFVAQPEPLLVSMLCEKCSTTQQQYQVCFNSTSFALPRSNNMRFVPTPPPYSCSMFTIFSSSNPRFHIFLK